jgi:alpha 1,2-mannosyltransferase
MRCHCARFYASDRFNRRFGYPWIFLNDGEFSGASVPFACLSHTHRADTHIAADEFKRRTSAIASGEIKFGKVPQSEWPRTGFPEGVDEKLAMEKIHAMGQLPIGIPYADQYRIGESSFPFSLPLFPFDRTDSSSPHSKMCRYQVSMCYPTSLFFTR